MEASMKFSPAYSAMPALAIALLVAAPLDAHATTIVDTFGPGNTTTPGNPAVGWNFNFDQKLGLSFTVSSRTEITDFLIALGGSGTFRLGVQSSASTTLGTVPSSTFLFDVLIDNPVRNQSVTGLSWTLEPATYFFVAQGSSFGSGGSWGNGVGGSIFLSVNSAPWGFAGNPAPAMRINGNEVSVVPELGSLSYLAVGLGLLGWLRHRRFVC